MAVLTKHCDRHPQRRAIGVCVITRRAICAECSTQYKGVNYSKEGLALLLQEQRDQEKKVGSSGRLMLGLLTLGAPLALGLVYLSVKWTGQGIIDFLQTDLFLE